MHENDLSSGPALLTITETARALGVSRDTVRRLINAGKLPVVELDTGSTAPTKRIRRTDLVEYVHGLSA